MCRSSSQVLLKRTKLLSDPKRSGSTLHVSVVKIFIIISWVLLPLLLCPDIIVWVLYISWCRVCGTQSFNILLSVSSLQFLLDSQFTFLFDLCHKTLWIRFFNVTWKEYSCRCFVKIFQALYVHMHTPVLPPWAVCLSVALEAVRVSPALFPQPPAVSSGTLGHFSWLAAYTGSTAPMIATRKNIYKYINKKNKCCFCETCFIQVGKILGAPFDRHLVSQCPARHPEWFECDYILHFLFPFFKHQSIKKVNPTTV